MAPHNKKTVSRELSKVVEKQLRNWEIERAQHLQSPREGEKQVHECITISREVGLPAFEVGTLLHQELGWPLFHRELLHAMAGHDDYRRRLYAHLDGRDQSWLEGFVRGLTLGRYQRDDYFHRLTATVLSIARQGSAIFIGRGTSFILPRDVGLRVRLTAPEDYCVASYAQQKGLSTEEAGREVEEIREDRAKFVRKHFFAALADPTMYDLTINMVSFSPQKTTELILAAMKVRGLEGKLGSKRE